MSKAVKRRALGRTLKRPAEQWECCICFEKASAWNGVMMMSKRTHTLQCGHMFHDACLSNWVHAEPGLFGQHAASSNTCPMCRTAFVPKKHRVLPSSLPLRGPALVGLLYAFGSRAAAISLIGDETTQFYAPLHELSASVRESMPLDHFNTGSRRSKCLLLKTGAAKA